MSAPPQPSAATAPPPPIAAADASAFAARVLWFVAVGGGALAVAWFVWAVCQRLPYPHELEWMEGALADHAWRVANGLPLYCEPSPEHVPFLYAPLPFWLGALGIALGVDGVLALRLVAVAATVGCAMLIGHWVRRDTGHLLAGLAASGMFVAGYGWLAWWYDLARNDTLFVLLVLAAAHQLRHGGAHRWLWAAVLATAAVLAKQSALMWLPAIAVGAAFVDWRTAARFAVASALGVAGALGLLHLASDGWSTFYLFEMPRHHGWNGDMKLGFWRDDMVWLCPLLLLGVTGFAARCRGGDARGALYLAAFGSGALLTSWLSRLHVGGFDNVLMYGLAGACVLGPVAAARARGRAAVAAAALVVAQLVLLGGAAWQRGTATLLPSDSHRRAHEQLAAFVAAQPGPVWMPGHGAITTRAGKGTGAHGQAIFDLLQALPRLPDGLFDLDALVRRERLLHLSLRVQHALSAFADSAARSLRERRFAAIVVDEVGTGTFEGLFGAALAGADLRPGTADDPYARQPIPGLDRPAAIAPLVGFPVTAPYVLARRAGD
jgi:hypothetical protein